MHFSAIVVAVICASSPLVAGHAAIIGAQGDAGGNGSAIGIVGSTPRDGTRRNPFQADATRFRGDAADTCGETIGAGTNDVESGTQQVLAASGNTLPQVSPGGQLQMTLHQVNSDGAGPYTCMIDPTGTGTQWTQINVAQNVPGSRRGRNRDGEATDFSLVADMPAGMSCTGTVAGQTNVCMVRCQNPARAGPFGGCVPVQQSGAGANNAAATPAAGGAAGIATPAAGAGTAGTAGTAGNTGTAGSANAGTAGSANAGTAGSANAGTAGTAGTAGSAGLSAGATTGTNNAFGQSAAGAADSAAADAQEEEEEEEDEDEEDRKKARSEQSTSGQADSAAADAADRENEAEDEAEDRAVKVIQRRVKINLVA
ncbi:Cas1 domain-containing hypothetical protein [Lasiodiplodia theobromae]|uniref:Cas1 domain-containing hypothetical protein n=1 Tax=Lasiodiplodia theobromae TaxID=45133 RepID=UPI0015C2F692|nr:Cas1 domain-containing hypothetical protein [Lasiodiplodia theobromae]KAF4546418.1 Cas1 domain-containing hypothetical protein [Lasiodiplodia theobromae]